MSVMSCLLLLLQQKFSNVVCKGSSSFIGNHFRSVLSVLCSASAPHDTSLGSSKANTGPVSGIAWEPASHIKAAFDVIIKEDYKKAWQCHETVLPIIFEQVQPHEKKAINILHSHIDLA